MRPDSWIRAVAASLLVIMLATVTTTAHAGCTTNTDCKGDRKCVDGRCVAPSETSDEEVAAKPQHPTSHQTNAATTKTDVGEIVLGISEIVVGGSLLFGGMGVSSADIGQGGNGAIGFLVSIGGGVLMITGFVIVIVWGAMGHPAPTTTSTSVRPLIGARGVGFSF
jgi:hypothetical protein